ncbi:MAG: hypothetical protein KC478_02460 [Bacteriovoracaceae bacterium]|nr:hypothetical protein [Bacteriovoracaceae bacterium]
MNPNKIKKACENESKRLKAMSSSVRKLACSRKYSFEVSLPLKVSEIERVLKNEKFNTRGIYAFELEFKEDGEELKNQLYRYRKGRKVPSGQGTKEAIVNLNKESESRYIYVGMISAKNNNLKNRLQQHFIGNQAHRTTSVRLKKWLKPNKLKSKKIKITIIPMSDDYKDLIRPLEKAIWEECQPLLGSK